VFYTQIWVDLKILWIIGCSAKILALPAALIRQFHDDDAKVQRIVVDFWNTFIQLSIIKN